MRVDYRFRRFAPTGKAAYFPSKSCAQRIMLCKFFSGGVIPFGKECEDMRATLLACKSVQKGEAVFCGENATLFRLMLPMLCMAQGGGDFILTSRLFERVKADFEDFSFALNLAIAVSPLGAGRMLVKAVKNGRSESYTIKAEKSSQFLSGLLMAVPLSGEGAEIRVVGNMVSEGYVRLTERIMKDFGVTIEKRNRIFYVPAKSYSDCGDIYCESDWSLNAVWLTAAALGGEVFVAGRKQDIQPDIAILDILKEMGCRIDQVESGFTAQRGTLRGVAVDVSETPDLALLLAVLCTCAEGSSRLFGMERLRLKESDRVSGACSLIKAAGGNYTYDNGCLTVFPRKKNNICEVPLCDSLGDHRIAMACAAYSAFDDIILKNACCTDKSCFSFYERFQELGGAYDVVHLGQTT